MSETIYLASISGGKDSAAMALHMIEQGIKFRSVFFDTGWEHPLVYEYLRGELADKIGTIEEIVPPLPKMDDDQEALAVKYEERLGHQSAMVRWIIKKSMFPSRRIRYCTDYLKIKSIKRLTKEVMASGLLPVNTVGIRAAESVARSKLPERELSTSLDCMVWRPILKWSTEDVIEIHHRHGLAPNPLYLKGANRVGCWPCIFSRKSEVRFLAETDSERIDLIRDLEHDIAEIRRSKTAPDKKIFLPTFFGQNGPKNNDMTSIDTMVEWAKTSRGGNQFNMFREDELMPGCMSWGLCDTGDIND